MRPSGPVTVANKERAVGMPARLLQVVGRGSGGFTRAALFGGKRSESLCRSAARMSAVAITSTVAITELVLWIGYLQWHFRVHGRTAPAEPVLRNFKNIEHRDRC